MGVPVSRMSSVRPGIDVSRHTAYLIDRDRHRALAFGNQRRQPNTGALLGDASGEDRLVLENRTHDGSIDHVFFTSESTLGVRFGGEIHRS